MFDASFLSHLQDTLGKISQNQGISKPGLYLIGTPIGNLADITLRGLAALQSVDVLFCEDTRVTHTLLKAYGLTKITRPYHAHNENRMGETILSLITEGKAVGLVSDAGLPLISDPGFSVVNLCIKNGAPITVIPGPSASLTALLMSGLSNESFSFVGFLSTKTKERTEKLSALQSTSDTLLFYEAPHRLIKTLAFLKQVLGDRRATVCRELTKRFEDTQRGTLSSLISFYQNQPSIKGEIVIVVEGARKEIPEADSILPLLSKVLQYLHVKEAATLVSALTGLPRKTLYEKALTLSPERKD